MRMTAGEHTNGNQSYLLYELQTHSVVGKADVRVLDSLFLVLERKEKERVSAGFEAQDQACHAAAAYSLLLQGEHVVVEKLVQFLICVVDAELLKRVHLRSHTH